MNKTVLLAAAAALALTAGGASAAGHHAGASAKGFGGHLPITAGKGAKTLYDQNTNSSGGGLLSINYSDSSSAGYDSTNADDFTVPKGQTWTVTEIDATGFYNVGVPANSETVTFYSSGKGKKGDIPGKPVKKGTFSNIHGTDSAGAFAISLGKGIKLKSGHYWVSIVANMGSIFSDGAWYWEENTQQAGSEYAWENPNNAFGLCASWCHPFDMGVGYGPDDMFALKGKSKK